MVTAEQLAQLSCGGFFLTGLITGFWKYRGVVASESAQAPVYVDICHRAALMYAFACLVLAQFARLSVWPEPVDMVSVALVVLFFASAVVSYVVHGVLQDTDNQFRRPYRVGERNIHGGAVSAYIYLLAACEIVGFMVLFAGFIQGL